MGPGGGDWMCGRCATVNFKKREVCHHCSHPKYGPPTDYLYSGGQPSILPGDWFCSCGAHNYASRFNCYKCGGMKLDSTDASSPPGWKNGDWICSRMGCGAHNYASRTECFKCNMSRDYGGSV